MEKEHKRVIKEEADILHDKQWRRWVLFQLFAHCSPREFLARLFLVGNSPQAVSLEQRERAYELHRAHMLFESYFQGRLLGLLGLTPQTPDGATAPSLLKPAAPLAGGVGGSKSKSTNGAAGFKDGPLGPSGGTGASAPAAPGALAPETAMISINMKAQQSKTNNREWHIEFIPNVAVFYRNDHYRIPKRLHPFCRLSLQGITTQDEMNDFDKFQKRFETALKLSTLQTRFTVNKQQLQTLKKIMHLFLLNDVLRLMTYEWCQHHAAGIQAWRSNPQHPFGTQIDSIAKQFPFDTVHQQFADLHAEMDVFMMV